MRACVCTSCGKSLSFTDDREFGFCDYCGTKVILDDYRSTHRFIDEAQIKKAETEKEIRLKELQLETEILKLSYEGSNFGKKLKIIWLVVAIVFVAICLGIILFGGSEDTPGGAGGFLFLSFIAAPIVGGGAYLVFSYIPGKEERKRLIQKGGLTFPSFDQSFEELSYQTLLESLESTGFINVRCINLRDTSWVRARKLNTISSVTVNGVTITSGGKVYLPGIPIVISYHGSKKNQAE